MRGLRVAAACLAAGLLSAAPAFGQRVDQWYCANSVPVKAIAACTRLIESGKLQGRALAEIYTSRGATYAQLMFWRQFEDSAEKLAEYGKREMADYDEAIRIDPKYAPPHFNRGVVFIKKKDYDQALADLNEAIRLGPAERIKGIDEKSRDKNTQNAEYLHQRGIVHSLKGDIDRAIADYSAALRSDPELAQAFYDRGLAYRTKGDTNSANADFGRATKLDSSLKPP